MPRLKKKRCCRAFNGEKIFKPVGIKMCEMDSVQIELDEFEAIRLCDYEGKNQIEASESIGLSRGTIQRLLQSGRKKILDALLHDKAIVIKNDFENISEEK